MFQNPATFGTFHQKLLKKYFKMADMNSEMKESGIDMSVSVTKAKSKKGRKKVMLSKMKRPSL